MQGSNYINRELSWIEFNRRVLNEARNSLNPCFERLNFLSICNSNLDEFFMVRVASLKDQVTAKYTRPDPSGLTPAEQIRRISEKCHKMTNSMYRIYNNRLLPELENLQIRILTGEDFSNEQAEFAEDYFNRIVYPVLTPMAVDNSRPFPLLLNKSLNIGVFIKGKKKHNFATVQVPSVLPRLTELPSCGGFKCFTPLEEIIKIHLSKLFTGREILSSACYRILRNADLSIDEEEAEDLLVEIEKSLKKRQWGRAVKLETENNIDSNMLSILKQSLEIENNEIYFADGPLDLTFLSKLSKMPGYDFQRYSPLTPKLAPEFKEKGYSIFDIISKKDVLLHHPYDSFQPVVDFITQAANDENVLAIKQTLYRVSGDSPVIRALVLAAERGKQVMVLLEVKARFDEENNIQWAKRLERAGCHVIYGLTGLKTHSKITLVVRQNDGFIKRYVHLGTGNYNDITARLYTDFGLFTCDQKIGEDASEFFNMLSGYLKETDWEKLSVAPINLRRKFYDLIDSSIRCAKLGKDAKIVVKMNSLADTAIIDKLYEASEAGVKIHLIIRGICCLRPGVKGLSENITVRSIVGRFLEHSRIFLFSNDGNDEIYMSSADWMPRNLNRRIELLFPVEDEALKTQIKDILEITLSDTVRARLLHPDGKYRKIQGENKLSDSQEILQGNIE